MLLPEVKYMRRSENTARLTIRESIRFRDASKLNEV